MSPEKILLFAGADHGMACTWRRGVQGAMHRFVGGSEGPQQFAAFLQSHRAPIWLLADLVEEDFRRETLPHLRGKTRAALLRRKLEQYYRDTPYRQAVLLQRHKEGRRDDDMLFSALTNPALLQPWLDVLLEQGASLAGIYSAPCLSTALVKSASSPHLLLLTWEKAAGLRQSYFEAGLLRFSRLTPLREPGSFGATAATEAVRTQQYLKNLSLLPPGAMLEVHVVCHRDDRAELEAHLTDNEDTQHVWLDIDELARRFGAKPQDAGSDAAPLLLHLLASHPPRAHYRATEHASLRLREQARRSLNWLSAALAAGCLLWSSANATRALDDAAEAAALNAQAEALSRQANPATPHTGQISTSEMKAAVLLARTLEASSPPPQRLLQGIGQTLEEFPRLRIDRLSWDMGAASGATPLVTLGGEAEDFGGDPRGALDYLERFRQALAGRGYRVTITEQPLDLSPQGSIAPESGGKPTRFALSAAYGSDK